MKIDINEKYRIQSDSVQIMVIVKGTVTKAGSKHLGEESTSTLGYFRTIQQAIKCILHQQILDSDATTLKQLRAEILRFEAEIEAAIKF